MNAIIFLAPLLIVAQGSSIYRNSGEWGGDRGCFMDGICPAVQGIIKYVIAEKRIISNGLGIRLLWRSTKELFQRQCKYIYIFFNERNDLKQAMT